LLRLSTTLLGKITDGGGWDDTRAWERDRVLPGGTQGFNGGSMETLKRTLTESLRMEEIMADPQYGETGTALFTAESGALDRVTDFSGGAPSRSAIPSLAIFEETLELTWGSSIPPNVTPGNAGEPT